MARFSITTLLVSLSAAALAAPSPLAVTPNDDLPTLAGCPPLAALVNASLLPSFSWAPDSPDALRLAACLRTASPARDACVFYTGGAAPLARRFAEERQRTTVYHFYGGREAFFDPARAPAREWAARGHLRAWYRASSRVYARACAGAADLVHPPGTTACRTSIWRQEELPAILGGESRVRQVWSVTRDGLRGWVRRRLGDAAAGGGVWRWLDLRKRVLPGWDGVVQRIAGGSSAQVEARLRDLQEAWGWRDGEEEDEWAVPATCER